MIDYKLKYQASIFLNASDMGATPKNIGDLMTAFSDRGFIPSIFQELNTANMQPQNRFRLQSQNNEWAIVIGSMRIDIEKNPINIKGVNLGSESDFCNEVNILYDKILNLFSKKANRLAFVSQFLLQEMSQTQLNTSYNKLFNCPQIYKDNVPFEWNWRTVASLEKEIEGVREKFNFVTTVNRINGEIRNGNQVSSIDRIGFNFDINSIPLSTEYRFDINKIKSFFNQAYLWENELKTEMEEFLA